MGVRYAQNEKLEEQFFHGDTEGHYYSHDVPEDGSIWLGVFGFDIEVYS